MRFYYISIFSILLLGLIYLIGTGLLTWFGLWLRKRWKQAWMLMVPLFLLLYAGPVAEEFWIAWNFGQLCKKDAGIFVYKTVEVEGFYDSTMRSAFENTKLGGYHFVEHATEDRKGVERVERVDEAWKNQALAWYARTNPGQERPRNRSIFYPLNDKETIAVLPNGVDAWRITRLDHPTARYHYTWPDFNTQVGHKIYKQSEAVIDIETRELLGGSNRYGRKSPWFYLALDNPGMSCPRAGEDPLKQPGLVYRRILNARKKGPEGE